MANAILIHNAGGGIDTDELTATPAQVLTGYTAGVKGNDEPAGGTMPNKTGTALAVPTNGRVLIPKGYHDGTQYATNAQATMAGGAYNPSTVQQVIWCAGKLMTDNIVMNPYVDYSYLLSSQTVFNWGSWGTLASAGLSPKGGGVIRTATSTQGHAGGCITYSSTASQSMCLAKSIDLTPYRQLAINYFMTSSKIHTGFVYLRPTSSGGQSVVSFDGSWPYVGSFDNLKSGNISWNGDELQKIIDISGYTGHYWIGFSINEINDYIYGITLIA